MADEIVLATAEQLGELLSEPGNNDLAVVHTASGSKKAKWVNILAWLFQPGRITSAMIGDGEVSRTKLGTNSVSQEKIMDASVTHAKLAQECVRERNILDGEVKTDKIANGAVTSVKIAAGAVGGGHIENGAIANEKIANGAVTTEKIDEDGVRTSNINDGAVTFAKLNDDVKGFLRNISIQGQSAGRGNISGRIPPDYNVDSEYTHVFEFYDVDKEPIVLLEERGGWPLSILSRGVSGLAPGVYAVTIVVAGEAGRDINYRLISIE